MKCSYTFKINAVTDSKSLWCLSFKTLLVGPDWAQMQQTFTFWNKPICIKESPIGGCTKITRLSHKTLLNSVIPVPVATFNFLPAAQTISIRVSGNSMTCHLKNVHTKCKKPTLGKLNSKHTSLKRQYFVFPSWPAGNISKRIRQEDYCVLHANILHNVVRGGRDFWCHRWICSQNSRQPQTLPLGTSRNASFLTFKESPRSPSFILLSSL